MTGHAAGPGWPTATPPPAGPVLHWELTGIAELPRVRADVRRIVPVGGPDPARAADLLDQLVLALDEMASNALRHGGGGVQAALRMTADAYLLEVSDSAVHQPPVPAIGRDPSEGGLGLYLIAEMATRHGWYVRNGCKHVWALLPRS